MLRPTVTSLCPFCRRPRTLSVNGMIAWCESCNHTFCWPPSPEAFIELLEVVSRAS
jgi:ribosomal protein L37AE/L43A